MASLLHTTMSGFTDIVTWDDACLAEHDDDDDVFEAKAAERR